MLAVKVLNSLRRVGAYSSYLPAGVFSFRELNNKNPFCSVHAAAIAFYSHWSKEYLQNRQKWFKKQQSSQRGELVPALNGNKVGPLWPVAPGMEVHPR